MAFTVLLAATQRGLGDLGAQFLGQRAVMRGAGLGFGGFGVEGGGKCGGCHCFALCPERRSRNVETQEIGMQTAKIAKTTTIPIEITGD